MRQAVKRRRLWVGIAVLLLVLVSGIRQLSRSRPEGGGLAGVRPVRSKLAVRIQSTGTVQPENRLEIKPPIAGRVEKVLVTEGTKVRKGQILAWMSSTERAALLDAASSKGSGELGQWKDFYKPTPILAPIDGTVIQRNIESGQTFTTQDPILVLSDRLTVKAQVDETDIARVKRGQTAVITLDAYSDQPIPSHVDQVAFDAKTVNNVTTYLVDVLPDVIPPFMRSGMTADVTFLVAEKDNALVIPSAALRTEGGHESVLVADPKAGGRPAAREVKAGLSDGKSVEILSGLTESDVVLAPRPAPGAQPERRPGGAPAGGPPGGGPESGP